MSVKADEYAGLSNDSYNDRAEDLRLHKDVVIGQVKYSILAAANNPTTDYQGTAYQRVDNGEVIISHRGTEPNAGDIKADAGMVFAGRNSQLDEAIKFTERVMALAKQEADKKGLPLSISVTGHSLGGTLAEITAAKYGVHAETFNAYGPAHLTNLGRYGVDVHAQHPNIVNHVRATDVVSAGGPHLGQVKIYAAPQDIESLRRGRYVGGSVLPGNPLLAADVSAHSIKTFLSGDGTLRESVMNPLNEARARAYAGPIAKYRHDVMTGRIDLDTIATVGPPPIGSVSGLRLGMQAADAAGTIAGEKAAQAMVSGVRALDHTVKAVGNAGEQIYDTTRDKVETEARWAADALERTGDAVREGSSRIIDKVTTPSSWFGASQTEPVPPLNQPQHPGNALYEQSLIGLEKINAERGIPSDQRTCNAAGTLAAAACQSGFKQIDFVAVSDNGSKLIAVQGIPGTAHSKVIAVDATVALNTPLAQSSEAFADAHFLQQSQQSQQQVSRPVQTQAVPALA